MKQRAHSKATTERRRDAKLALAKQRYWENPGKKCREMRDHYHGGGWITKRKRDLRLQRGRAEERLAELEAVIRTLEAQ